MKQKSTKRILSLLLAVAMLLTLLPQAATPARAEDEPVYSGTCGDNLTWTFDPDTGTLTIEGSGGMADFLLSSIPWYTYRTEITSITLPDGLTTIGNCAFDGCTGLTEVTIPESVTSIGSYAFSGCTGLTSMTIPNGVTSIGDSAFSGCAGLTEMTIPESVTSIGSSAFSRCAGLTEVTIPEGVTAIGSYTFDLCTGLTLVTIPEGVTTIGYYAFYGCTSLTAATVLSYDCNYDGKVFPLETTLYGYEDSTTQEYANYYGNPFISLGYAVLHGTCGAAGDNLTWTLSLETGLLCILGSGNMRSYDPNLGYTAPWYKYRSNIISLELPEGLTSISSGAFRGCEALTSLEIPDSVTSIGNRAFYKCAGLTSVTIPGNVTSINQSVFEYCTGLTEVTIPESVTSIRNSAFCFCTGLTSVTIPDSVTSIGFGAFQGCSGLTSVTIPSSVTLIEGAAFTSCAGLICFIVEDGNPSFSVDSDGVLFNLDGSKLVCCPGGKNGVYQIPSSVTTIGEYAFNNCRNLNSVLIPETVTMIEKYAFSYCVNLTALTIPDSVEYINYCAFKGCSGLTSVTLPGSIASITTYLFEDCTGLTEVTIPGSVTSIGSSAFSGCTGLTSIVIPENVSKIGSNAFMDCSCLCKATITNTTCSIGASKTTFGKAGTTVLFGYTGSTTEAYAQQYNYAFVPLGTALQGECGAEGENLTWVLDADTGLLSISGSGAMQNYNYSTLPWYPYRSLIASLSLSEHLTSIGDCAFYNCTGLTEVTIPASVTSIGSSAFYNCTGLTEVTIPEGVTSIGSSAFYKCTGLTEVTIPDSVTSIGSSAFSGCAGLTEVTIPESVVTIDSYAFYKCTGLQRATILNPGCEFANNSLPVSNDPFTIRGYRYSSAEIYAKKYHVNFESIGDLEELTGKCGENAYWHYNVTTHALTITGTGAMTSAPWRTLEMPVASVTLPEGLTTIFDNAFSQSDINEIEFPVSLEAIGDYTFSGCTGLTEVMIPEGVTTIGSYAFAGCTGLTAVTISEGVNTIGSKSFFGCTGLTSVTLPNSLTAIQNGAFCNCSALTEIILPAGLQQLGTDDVLNDAAWMHFEGPTGPQNGVFEGCTSLTNVVFREGLPMIGAYAFYGCSSLKTVRLPESVKTIAYKAFADCSSLIALVVPSTDCVVKQDGIVEDAYDTSEDLYYSEESSVNCLGNPGKTVIYGTHDPEKENAEPMTETFSFIYHPADSFEVWEITLTLLSRYLENYAKVCGYTFYETGVFSDVASGKYYEIPVAWAYGRGITSGKDDTHFAPNETCTRGQVVTFLWNAMGKPVPTITDCPFVDVKPGKYYYDAMLWALETGVTSGKDDTHFAPNETCTRGQVVTFIWNAMGKPEPTITDCPFVDVKPGKYYYNAMLWALENGVTSGTDATHFGPNQTCTRGQVVTFLYNTLS